MTDALTHRDKAVYDVRIGGLSMYVLALALYWPVFDTSILGFLSTVTLIWIGAKYAISPEEVIEGAEARTDGGENLPQQDCPYCEDGTMYYDGDSKVRCESCDATRMC